MITATVCAMFCFYMATMFEGTVQIVFLIAMGVSYICALALWSITKDRISQLEHKLKEKDNA